MPIAMIKYSDGHYSFEELHMDDLQSMSPPDRAEWIRFHCVNLTDTEWALYKAWEQTSLAWYNQIRDLSNKLDEFRRNEGFTEGVKQ